MELVKNIFFNTDKLTPFIKVKISYTGKFFSDDSQKVFIHYGFGENWDNNSDLEMVKTELGYQTEVELINSCSFNFCFFNNNNEWDNNDSKNYIFPIEHAELNLISLDGDYSLISPRRLTKFYLWKKKFRLNIYKAITFLPKLFSGKYKRKISNI